MLGWQTVLLAASINFGTNLAKSLSLMVYLTIQSRGTVQHGNDRLDRYGADGWQIQYVKHLNAIVGVE